MTEPRPSERTVVSRRRPSKLSGPAKLLMTALSLGAFVGGWSLIARQESKADGAAPEAPSTSPATPAPAPVVWPAIEPLPSLPPVPTIAPLPADRFKTGVQVQVAPVPAPAISAPVQLAPMPTLAPLPAMPAPPPPPPPGGGGGGGGNKSKGS